MCNINDLTAALDWCAANGVKLISLSMGTTSYRDAELLQIAVRSVSKSGITVFASANNDGLLTYPACFDECIGVCFDRSKTLAPGTFSYIEHAYNGINVIFNPDISDIYGINSSNSYATAYFAGIASKLIDSEADMRQWLSDNSTLFEPNVSLYEYAMSAISEKYNEDVIFAAFTDKQNHADSTRRQLCQLFLESGYYCIDIHYDDIPNLLTYCEYITVMVQTCRPNIVFVDFNKCGGKLPVDVILFLGDLRENLPADTSQIDINEHSPKEIFNKIISIFDRV